METLWTLLAEHCREYMDKVPPHRRTAAHLNLIRGFLKDNGVAANAAHKVDLVGRVDSLLMLGLPFGESGKDH